MRKIDYTIKLNDSAIIKCIAICAMLWHHLFLNHQEFGVISFRLAMVGKICVALFVFISGYGMAIKFSQIMKNSSLKERTVSTVKFLARRLLKFYFNYWVVFIVALSLGVFVFNRPLSVAYGSEANTWFRLCRDFFGFGSLESYNVTWWFNRLIIALWLIFPVLYWSMNSKYVSVLMLVLLYFNPDGILRSLNIVASGLSTYMVVFAVGIFIAIHIERINSLLNRVNPYVVCASLFLITFVLLYMRNIRVTPYFIGTSVDPFAVLFVSLTVVSLCRLTTSSLWPMAFVGRHSMNVYLIHTFIFSYFFPDFIYGFKCPLLIFAVLLLVSLFVSIAIEFVKEKMGFYRMLNRMVNVLS